MPGQHRRCSSLKVLGCGNDPFPGNVQGVSAGNLSTRYLGAVPGPDRGAAVSSKVIRLIIVTLLQMKRKTALCLCLRVCVCVCVRWARRPEFLVLQQ